MNVKKVEIFSSKLKGTIGYFVFDCESPERFEGSIKTPKFYPEFDGASTYLPSIPQFLADASLEQSSQNITI